MALPALLAPFDRGYALPGSEGQIVLVPLPGHAAGHIGAFILTDAGWTLLASDAAWSPQSYQTLRGPSRLANLVMDDAVAYTRTLERLNQLWAGGQVNILLCHEGTCDPLHDPVALFPRPAPALWRSCGAGGASGPAARGLCPPGAEQEPYFQRFNRRPFAEWPQMDKALMMAQFDRMNTAGLSREAVLACAQRSEADRDFTPKIGRYSVGLSSGTSGQRGVFVVSPREQQVWAGGMLAKMLPDGLLAGERVALFLRADNNLYHSVNNRWLSLAFYDLLAPFSEHLPALERQAPSIIVAPAQVLRALALAVLAGQVKLPVKKRSRSPRCWKSRIAVC